MNEASLAIATPLITLGDGPGALLGKAEHLLPSGSIKHRSIVPRVLALHASGRLAADQAIVIHSAGSAAVAAAWAGASIGRRVHAIVPRSAPEGVLALLRWLGAECHLIASSDAPGHIASLCEREGAYHLDQFADRGLCDGYAVVTDEILAQCPAVEVIVVGIGTGGSITGIAQRARECGARCKIVGVEPAEAQLTRGMPWAPHEITGLAPPQLRSLFTPELVDEVIPVASAVAWQWAGQLARRHGLLVGPSSGATVAAAQQLRDRGHRHVVAILGGAMTELLTAERVARHASPTPIAQEHTL